jgi:hypothetical protein
MDRHWVAYQHAVDVIQDMIYFKNKLKEGFHVLSDTEDVAVYTPNGGPSAPLVMSRSSYQVQKRPDYKTDDLNLSRYLVESRGKLLMVLRQLKECRDPKGSPTFRFRIFEMNHGIAPGGGSVVSWVELQTLPGRLLLLGRGCSRAFEVSQFNRLEVGHIYYSDDTRFNISLALKSGSKHSGTDMGVDVQKKLNRRKRTWRFPRQFTSECYPIWFAP